MIQYEVVFTVVLDATSRQDAAQQAREYLVETASEVPAEVRQYAPLASRIWTHKPERGES